ncbi:hypothetical protein AGMMS50229_09700 [Campylobacterota bacterium]|nr:hypothetical protein AGMMS50229_09700 [Campylobacterota bacterium]
MRYHFQIHKENGGFWAECCELEGCATQGDTLEELAQNCHEALNLYLEEPSDSQTVIALPSDSQVDKRDVIEIGVEPEVALGVLLRHHRLSSNMTQKQAAKLLGMQNIYSYQRLERRSNLSNEL